MLPCLIYLQSKPSNFASILQNTDIRKVRFLKFRRTEHFIKSNFALSFHAKTTNKAHLQPHSIFLMKSIRPTNQKT
ncbi:hypothetical protein LEP1GSC005_1989 [Leptospira santarosai str. ST188]|nr:hypothetical protein LEP1GSC005_1989 [Leptospira santarosai str. ST188]